MMPVNVSSTTFSIDSGTLVGRLSVPMETPRLSSFGLTLKRQTVARA
jgi:hypothetical protein